ncbi:MAG: threonine synthase [Lentisphaeria bacterium]
MNSAQYISTRGGIQPVDFIDAVMMGLAEDGGLLLPAKLPDCRSQLDGWRKLSYTGLAFEVMRLFVGEAIPQEELKELIRQSYSTFRHPDIVPLVPLSEQLFLAELFHGPTLAFKDIALQFLGNLFGYVLKKRGGELNIIGATSGDTGSAAIHGVRGKSGIHIFILYPNGRVSPIQEQQMASVPDANVHCLAINGTFDDGQRVLKEVFNDLHFKREFSLGAVNSVNWVRILAQIVYYFWASFRVQEKTGYPGTMQIAVPTGNFGDIFAGYIALRMGAPIHRLILASNENDILSRFFNTGEYSLGSVRPTLSPSMDIQVASNFERYLYYRTGQDSEKVVELMQHFAAEQHITLPGNDPKFAAGKGDTEKTLATIRKYYDLKKYILDPHSAVGVSVAEKFQLDGIPTICLATAHPGKFPEAIQKALGNPRLANHPELSKLAGLPLRKTVLDASRETIENFVRTTLNK